MKLLTSRVLRICALLFVISELLFVVNLQFPVNKDFDEFHYVPSAKQFLALQPNQNYEHPPLAKELMAVGIAVAGDNPIGWRLMSTIFGAATLVGVFLWALAVFESEEMALFAAALTLVNQLLYVQARIGMLDTFMMAFLAWAFAAFSASMRPGEEKPRKLLLISGAFFGLATASKWFAVIPWLACAGLFALNRLLTYWRVRFENPRPQDWYRADLWKGITPRQAATALIAMPLTFYYLTFIPFFFIQGIHFNLGDLLWGAQKAMYEGQLRVGGTHPYGSTWPQWALLIRPIWYAFDKEGAAGEFVRGVILLGNPLIMWGGLLGLVLCAWGFIVDRRRDALQILFLYCVLYFSWAIVPRKLAFYYYYYPAGMTLSLSIVYALYLPELRRVKLVRYAFLVSAVGLFIYFFPILAALKIPADSFRNWMWLSSWI